MNYEVYAAKREAYFRSVGGHVAGAEFEERCLSIGREFLPRCAKIVLNGGEPTGAYWTWLKSQANKVRSEGGKL